MNIDIRFVGELQRIQPQPGDVFVLTVSGILDAHTAGSIRESVSRQIGCPTDKVLVLGEGLKLEVVGAEG